jgi:hypothetical protein
MLECHNALITGNRPVLQGWITCRDGTQSEYGTPLRSAPTHQLPISLTPSTSVATPFIVTFGICAIHDEPSSHKFQRCTAATLYIASNTAWMDLIKIDMKLLPESQCPESWLQGALRLTINVFSIIPSFNFALNQLLWEFNLPSSEKQPALTSLAHSTFNHGGEWKEKPRSSRRKAFTNFHSWLLFTYFYFNAHDDLHHKLDTQPLKILKVWATEEKTKWRTEHKCEEELNEWLFSRRISGGI